MLEQLNIADPQTHDWLEKRLTALNPPASDDFLAVLEEETIWALSQEQELGRIVARGLLALNAAASRRHIPTYCRHVHENAETGVTLARIMATHLVPVLRCIETDPTLLDDFLETTAIMLAKGTYTLNAPLELLSGLLDQSDLPSARAFLHLLAATFRQPISYNQSLRLVYLLPKAAGYFAPRRRRAQIEQLRRAVETDPELADTFLEGMYKGLALLSAKALNEFMDKALSVFHLSPESGRKFLALISSAGRDTCAALQVAVPLIQVRGRLSRYITARLGRALPVEPVSAMPEANLENSWACSDGRRIYLPDEIDHFNSSPQNEALYATLARLEACFYECGSFEFDLERAADLYPAVAGRLPGRKRGASPSGACDARTWFDTFSAPALAEDLFNLYEQARIIRIISQRYPGLIRQVQPVLQTEAERIWALESWRHPLIGAYARLVLNMNKDLPLPSDHQRLSRVLARCFASHPGGQDVVEATAAIACTAFDELAECLPAPRHGRPMLATPFGWRLKWGPVERSRESHNEISRAIKSRLAEQGVKIYRSDLQLLVASRNGQVSMDDLQTLILTQGKVPDGTAAALDWSRLDLEDILKAAGCRSCVNTAPDGSGCRYPEWDCQVRDYLHEHTRVQEIQLPRHNDDDFYRRTLSRCNGLLSHIRRAFELIKPEGLTLLRQWPEGDAFDYRALLDFAVDRRAGLIPSDRLFIKRLKKERNVAVLLLVDMSRSTANAVSAGRNTVLDVAKEAVVLFCEALQVVGDTYSIAGFSGTGRHSVDYFGIKDFQEPLNSSVRGRISTMTPQRSTRMGAAIRHAAAKLGDIPAAVRLLIVVSDGFPNDIGYKNEYAIADTRRAIQEARSRGHHVKAITVNIGNDPRLDDLYGRYHYHVIEDVVELPDKLIRMYGTLTKV